MPINSDIQDLMYRLLPRLLTQEMTEDTQNRILGLLRAVQAELEHIEHIQQRELESELERDKADFDDWERRYRAAIARKEAEKARQIARIDRLEQRVERIERRLGLSENAP